MSTKHSRLIPKLCSIKKKKVQISRDDKTRRKQWRRTNMRAFSPFLHLVWQKHWDDEERWKCYINIFNGPAALWDYVNLAVIDYQPSSSQPSPVRQPIDSSAAQTPSAGGEGSCRRPAPEEAWRVWRGGGGEASPSRQVNQRKPFPVWPQVSWGLSVPDAESGDQNANVSTVRGKQREV